MQLIKQVNTKFKRKIIKLYKSAFPKEERKPLALIKKLVKSGKSEVFALLDNKGHFAGEVITIVTKSIVLIDYLAISEHCRSLGYGSKALSFLKEIYNNKTIILEIEDPEEVSDNTPLRLKRKDFYLKNGFHILDFKISLFGCKMLVLSFGDDISFKEYYALQKTVYPFFTVKKIKKL